MHVLKCPEEQWCVDVRDQGIEHRHRLHMNWCCPDPEDDAFLIAGARLPSPENEAITCLFVLME